MRTERTRVRRSPARASYDPALLRSLLDEAVVSHLAFTQDDHPYAIPTLHARIGERVYVHGSSASRALRQIQGGLPACLTVTLIDGLVVARSAFNLSVNYRSAVILGTATLVPEDEKLAALEAFTNQIVPGRWDDVRPPSAQELKATSVLALSLEEASVKTRQGQVTEGEEDVAFGGWAGIIPMTTQFGPAETTPDVPEGVEMPDYVRDYRRPGATDAPDTVDDAHA